MSRRTKLLEAVREVLSQDQKQDYFCKHDGKFYKFSDIDLQTWKPKPGSQGTLRAINNRDLFRIGNLRIYF